MVSLGRTDNQKGRLMTTENDVEILKLAITRLHRFALQNASSQMRIVSILSAMDSIPAHAQSRLIEAMHSINDQIATIKEIGEILRVEDDDESDR
ncbi:hypothetical protein CJT89_32685 [Pseudomonas aeruginosa]|nr:hypothetical protein BPPAE11_00350 [Pseudomonas phage YMC/01/01/P52_PAE_BP]ETV63486.1 hypothetical protein Q042_00507 [Pseudomonas aeruginosa BWHPSA037]KSM17667.2 hypothetical protein APA65_28475 [Pseudomonas aeruginosa]KSO44458.1 hypothetical protein APB05_09185 [Pseudomonas aeruginosa]OTI32773.1 hypothetical protein CAY95_10665 [Pseudomonas aeruginosa]